MHYRSAKTLVALVALVTLAAGAVAAQGQSDASSPRTLEDTMPVRVEWSDPQDFSEIRYSRNRFEARSGRWVQGLAEHLQQQAAQALGPGERLELRITDIDLAGEYEPLAADVREVRVVRDVYPPRMNVDFVRYGADGQVVQQGSRRLVDPGFLGATPGSTQDPLRFEKRMIDDWVRREFRSKPALRIQR